MNIKMDPFFNLFIFEMANNHSGDVNHGLKIIEEIHKISKNYPFQFAFKFQYRDLDTFIHPDFKGRQDIKYVKRFSETRLSESDYKKLKDFAKELGFVTICTPFDEKSVDLIEHHDYDILKVASCSFTDWPLLERIVKTNKKPIIASTAGATFDDIDRVVAFFAHREKKLCIMHCVGEYPTLKENLQLNQIELLRNRYPEISVGFSTHEEPENLDSIKIAIAKGAKVFERHVSIKSDKYAINNYSSTPAQIDKWLLAAKDAISMCGIADERNKISEKEINDLRGLKRGLFASQAIKKGEKLLKEKLFYAIPNIENQVLANDFSKYSEYVAMRDFNKNEAITFSDISVKHIRAKVLSIINQVKDIINKSNIILPNRIDLELSHHYGIENFEKNGAAILNCINREYCKKIIIILPGQSHPVHKHVKKEETFHVMYGEMVVNINGEDLHQKAGDILTVERDQKHSFSSKNGCIFEEVSTTHYKDDSYYDDQAIIDNKFRKTEMTFWSDWLRKNLK